MKILRLIVVTFVTLICTQHLFAGDNRFSSRADNTLLIDNETGLMWPTKDNGSDISWPAAKEYCKAFKLGDYDDWRMPTQKELATLYDLEAANSSEYYIHLQVSITACCQWAIDEDAAKVGSFDFEYGYMDWGYPMSTVDARVLPVRNVIK